MSKPVVVIGDGWSALGTVGFLALQGTEVRWVAGTGARHFAPLPMVAAGPGMEAWQALATGLGIDCGEPVAGSYVREFRSKAFKEPPWAKGATAELKREIIDVELWAPERYFVPLYEARFGLTLAELEEQARARLTGGEFAHLRRIEGVPVTGVKLDDRQVRALVLGSGEEIECERIVYADRWAELPRIEGLPKAPPFTRKREPVGILQATFSHEPPVGSGLMEGFFSALPREAGEEMERHLWGYFTSDGKRSFWTLSLNAEESEDNHEIAKKLRRMKNNLEKMFTGSSWLPDASRGFMSTVRDESVRFEEWAAFSDGEVPAAPQQIPQARGMVFLTDGYGASAALQQVHALFHPQGTDAQAERMDFGDAAVL